MNTSRFFFFILGAFATSIVGAQEVTLQFSPPQKLTSSVNSAAEESFPILSADGKTLYFARTYHNANVGGKYAGQDIYFSNHDGKGFGEAKPLSDLNDARSNVVVGVSEDHKRLYLLNAYTGAGKVLPGVSVSRYDSLNGTWGTPTTVFIPNLHIKNMFYSAFVSPDEDYILFSLPTSSGDSANNDLFVSLSADRGETWNSPIDLGAAINSPQDEISPYYDAERGVLFYSTNKRSGDHRYDVHYSTRLDDSWTSWSAPRAMDFNSAGFDAYFFSTADGTAYFSSNRGDSLTDIYITQILPEDSDEEEEEVVEEETAETAEEAPPVDEGETESAVEPEEGEREHELIIETGGEKVAGRSLRTMTKEELLNESTIIRFVYFGFDRYHITQTYIEVLDDVAALLDKYPELYVKINGYTDGVGSEAYNQVLSENRAASTKEWLVMNGIDPSRVVTEGFGKRDPYASNATPDGRAMNRRVEIFFRESK